MDDRQSPRSFPAWALAALLALATTGWMLTVALPVQAQSYNVIYDFPTGFSQLSYSEGGMLLHNGKLYGTRPWGGTQQLCCGQFFELTHGASGWSLSEMFNFKGAGWGIVPTAFAFAPDGNVYGTANMGGLCGGLGCGVIFALQPSNWTETKLYRFQGRDDGSGPDGDIVIDQAGNLYGMSNQAVYELSPANGGWTETTLHEFGQGDQSGFYPSGGLVSDRNGNLYGATYLGGDLNCYHGYGCGLVFQMVPSAGGWIYNVIYVFEGGTDGGGPSNGVVLDGDGNLYGTTGTGGANGFGTVFKLSPGQSGWTITTLYDLNNGGASKVTLDSAGNVYGYNVIPGYRTAYKLTPGGGGWTYTELHEFACETGCTPAGRMAVGESGELYGIALEGGASGYGVVFEIIP